MILTKAQRKTVSLATLFLWFIIYSFIGWIYETMYCSFEAGRYVNRGFLFGPLCPIYGISIVLMIVILTDRCRNLLSMFLYCAVIASIIELLSSYWMEMVFGRRWWDYSEKLINFEGRVCLEAAILFGICGIFIIQIFHPVIIRLIEQNLTEKMLRVADKIIFSVLFFDIMLSFERSLQFVYYAGVK